MNYLFIYLFIYLKGCGNYINYNELIKKAGSSKKGAFLLAKRSDYILNKSSKDIHDLEESVQDVVCKDIR